jgi:hypothetical protein
MIRVLGASVAAAPGVGEELLEHAAKVSAAIASKLSKRFDIYILLGLLPEATRTWLPFDYEATFPAAIGLGWTASGDTMRGSLDRVKRQVIDPTAATIQGQKSH